MSENSYPEANYSENAHHHLQPPDASPDLYRIGEVSRLTGTKPFVLRYWETEFPMLQPVKSPKGHRLYRRQDVDTVLLIKRLLYDDGFTIAGARRHLHEIGVSQRQGAAPESGFGTHTADAGRPNAHPGAEPSHAPTQATGHISERAAASAASDAAHISNASAAAAPADPAASDHAGPAAAAAADRPRESNRANRSDRPSLNEPASFAFASNAGSTEADSLTAAPAPAEKAAVPAPASPPSEAAMPADNPATTQATPAGTPPDVAADATAVPVPARTTLQELSGGRLRPAALATIDRAELLDLRDALRSFLTLLESE